MAAEDIVEDILKSGVLVGGRQRYRNVSKIVSGERMDVDEPVNFRRPAWPGGHRASEYRTAADTLTKLAHRKDIPFHVPASEILKTVECRISEMLYFTAFYPERMWGQQQNPLPVWKKIKLAHLMFPENAFPAALVTDIQSARNVVEHQFAEPDYGDIARMSNTMHLFLDRTDKIIDILKDVSMVEYHVEDTDELWRLQFCRDGGIIVMFRGEYSSASAQEIKTKEHIVRDADYCTRLVQRILTDFDELEADPWEIFNLDEVMPDNLGPDLVETPDIDV